MLLIANLLATAKLRASLFRIETWEFGIIDNTGGAKMWGLLSTLVTFAAAGAGFVLTRDFVRRRLRFVDAIQSPAAPFIVAAVVAVLAWPFALLPLVTKTTAAFTAIAAGFGTASGAKAIRRDHLLPARRS